MSLLLHETALQLLGPALFLANVVSVQDPENRNRVQVRLYNANGIADQDGPIWARVSVPFAGGNRGAFFIPDVGDEVVVAFLGGDPRGAIVLGSLWNGHDSAPETIGGSGKNVDRWTITGKAGTRIAIVEQPASSATIKFSTPGDLPERFPMRTARLNSAIRKPRRCASIRAASPLTRPQARCRSRRQASLRSPRLP